MDQNRVASQQATNPVTEMAKDKVKIPGVEIATMVARLPLTVEVLVALQTRKEV